MNFSAVNVLIQRGYGKLLINAFDNFLMTPMHIACINYSQDIFEAILCLSPDMTFKDQEGKTPIDYLKENDEIPDEILNML